jgi:Na+/H+ antiporter NhaD/arsenite permease-like protein
MNLIFFFLINLIFLIFFIFFLIKKKKKKKNKQTKKKEVVFKYSFFLLSYFNKEFVFFGFCLIGVGISSFVNVDKLLLKSYCWVSFLLLRSLR